MKRRLFLVPLLILGFGVAFAASAQSAAGKPAASGAPDRGDAAARRLALATKSWKGDFDAMLERRVVRVYVPYSRSLYL